MFKQPVDRVKFNVGGISMETERINVLKHPSSKLFEIISAQEPKTVFIDMNPLVFLTILDYFRTGKCYLPSNVNQDLLVLSFRSLGIPVPLEMIPSRPIGFEQTHDNAPPAYQDLMGPTLTQLDDILRTTMPILYMHLSRGTHRLRLIYHTLNDRSFLNDPRVPLDNYPLEDIRLGKMDPPLSFLLQPSVWIEFKNKLTERVAVKSVDIGTIECAIRTENDMGLYETKTVTVLSVTIVIV